MNQKTLEYVEKHTAYMKGGLLSGEESKLLGEMDDLWYSMSPEEIEWCENNIAPIPEECLPMEWRLQ